MNDSTWLNDARTMSYDNAQHLRYAVGVWSEDQWEAFVFAWENGAPRMCHVYGAEPFNAHTADLAHQLLTKCSSWSDSSAWPKVES